MSFTDLMNTASSAVSSYGLYAATLAVDVVRITDDLGNQLFSQSRAMRAAVNRSSELCEHPLETGNTIADFKVIKPNVAQLTLFIPSDAYGSVYKEIEAAYVASTSLIVQTRASSFANMVITDMPHDEAPDLGDIVAVSLTLKEVVWFTSTVETMPAKEVAANPKTGAKSDADTVKQGQKRATDASSSTQTRSSSVLKDILG
ncbi:phage baseplate protein [Cronobacter turicensis]|nr:hypothetical protein [Cronobacter turicensis]